MKILLVDDEPMYLKSLGKLLILSGYGVATATGGLEALRRYHAEKADLIITDACMEGGSGTELIRKLRETDHDVRIVIHTGCWQEEENGLDAGANGVLKKPSSLDQIKKIVEDITAA